MAPSLRPRVAFSERLFKWARNPILRNADGESDSYFYRKLPDSSVIAGFYLGGRLLVGKGGVYDRER